MDLRHLTDKTLLLDTKSLVAQERVISLKVIHHLKEIERRRLFADLGYGSLFEYAIRELGYSDSSAMRRINAARLLKDLPEIEKKIEDGSLSLTNLSLANQLFKNEDIQDKSAKKEILSKIENTTKKECEEKLHNLSSPKLLPSEPIVYAITFKLSPQTMDELKELRDLLAHKRWKQDEIVGFAFKMAIEHLKKQLVESTSPAKMPRGNSRYIPKSLERFIFIRDKCCTNCGSTHRLEIDHIKPFALGGKTTKENLRVLCYSCNQRARIRQNL